MTANLSYIRQQLIAATADLSGATKGQLLAWLENAQFDTSSFRRKKPKIYDDKTGKWITLDNPPIQGRQSLAKGTSIALVQPVEFATASWRRALAVLDDHHMAWLFWNYSENIRFEYQVTITRWGWGVMKEELASKRIAAKTKAKLEKLIWLAAQDVKTELAGRDVYEQQELAQLVDVNRDNWCHNYRGYWLAMRNVFLRLDTESLFAVKAARSKQKAAFSVRNGCKSQLDGAYLTSL